MIRVTVWNEYVHEQRDESVAKLYPEGIHGAIAAGLRRELGDSASVRFATLGDPEHGLPEDVLRDTDVLTWWGHDAHDKVADAVVERVHARVMEGMGIVVLHSGHYAKIFKRLMGTTCALRWRSEAGSPGGERELVWTVNPGHPIAARIPQPIVIPNQEMYGEFFDIPPPDALVFISSFAGGEVFRSGCCFTRGAGRVFYFGPGDQAYPVYHHEDVQRVIANAVRWCAAGSRGNDLPADRGGSPKSNRDWYMMGA